jgi:CRP-like cAMP-binding protein
MVSVSSVTPIGSFSTPVTEMKNSNPSSRKEIEDILSEQKQVLQQFLKVNERLHTQLAVSGVVGEISGRSPGEAGWREEPGNYAWKGSSGISAAGGEMPTSSCVDTGDGIQELLLSDTSPRYVAPAKEDTKAFLPGAMGDDSEDNLFQTRAMPPPAPNSRAAPDLELAPIMPVADSARTIHMAQPESTSESPYPSTSEAQIRDKAAEELRKSIKERDPHRPIGSRVSMDQRETIEFLSKVSLFRRLSPENHADLCDACEEVEYPKSEMLIKQGESGEEFYLLVTGRVSVIVDGVKVAVLTTGDYFGENALMRSEARTATVMAESQVRCLRIAREIFQELGLADKISLAARQTAPKSHNAVFADAAAMKEKLRIAMAKPAYDVKNFYYDTGVAQRIARSNIFDNATLLVIAFNAIWISVDTDYNDADLLITAEPVFILAESFFCIYFSFEWLVRFLSFRRKRDGLRDGWFVFDSSLVAMMVGETVVMNAIVLVAGGASSGGMGNASILRLFRLLRLSRMARMARLLRAMPELMVVIKGMVVAMRTVFFILLLLVGIIYVFGIAFVQLMRDDTDAGMQYFPTVPRAMNSLLLDGVLPDQAQIITDVGNEHPVFYVIICLYILLASMTVMNMLVGVLCEVVSVVSSVEKESLLVNYVKGTLLHMLQTSGLDADGDHLIAKHEFEALLENPIAAKALSEVGVDVIGLVDFTDFIFKEGRDLSFPDFMEIILQLRGSNTATVKDLVDLRKLVMSELDKLATKQHEDMEKSLTYFMGNPNRGHERSLASKSFDFGHGGLSTGGQFGGINAGGTGNSMAAIMALKDRPDMQGLSWAAAASIRLSAAATELSAAAGELNSRQQRNKQKALQM